ncbi:MAG: TRAP transporter small permease [Dehalococcoidales bacterium]|nr:TRAP transporter small permease [Dehalococcoidales bacterium]
MKKVANIATRIISEASKLLGLVAVAMLVLMMLLTVGDIFLRTAFDKPISGSAELTGYMMIFAAFFGLAWCAMQGMHVKVDLIIGRFSPRIQGIFNIVNSIVVIGVLVLLSWRTFVEALAEKQAGGASIVTQIPNYPFIMVISFGTGFMILAMIVILCRSIYKAVKG